MNPLKTATRIRIRTPKGMPIAKILMEVDRSGISNNFSAIKSEVKKRTRHENILAIEPLLELYKTESRFEKFIYNNLSKIIRAKKNSSIAKLVSLASEDDKKTYNFIISLLKSQMPDSMIILGEFLTADDMDKKIVEKINSIMSKLE